MASEHINNVSQSVSFAQERIGDCKRDVEQLSCEIMDVWNDITCVTSTLETVCEKLEENSKEPKQIICQIQVLQLLTRTCHMIASRTFDVETKAEHIAQMM